MTAKQFSELIKDEYKEQEQDEPNPEPIGSTLKNDQNAEAVSKPTERKATPKKKEPEPVARQSTWILEGHFDRLDALKLKQKKRLKQQGKRVSVTSLIDEAIEQYLKKME